MKYIVENLKNYPVAFMKWEFLPGENEMKLSEYQAQLISSSSQFVVHRPKKKGKKQGGKK